MGATLRETVSLRQAQLAHLALLLIVQILDNRMIALVGLPGSGKSTIGKVLARRLARVFFDSDSEIEKRAGMTVRAFFSQFGEPAFRDLEAQVIEELCAAGGGVIATGGGAVLRESSRKLLHERAKVAYIRATPRQLYQRLKNDQRRPLLQVADPLKKLEELFVERDPLYREACHFIVDTGRPPVNLVVSRLLMQLEMSGFVVPAHPVSEEGQGG